MQNNNSDVANNQPLFFANARVIDEAYNLSKDDQLSPDLVKSHIDKIDPINNKHNYLPSIPSLPWKVLSKENIYEFKDNELFSNEAYVDKIFKHLGSIDDPALNAIVKRIFLGRKYSLDEVDYYLQDNISKQLIHELDLLKKSDHQLFSVFSSISSALKGVDQDARIGILCDYDVDGACSAAIIYHTLNFLGYKNIKISVPFRDTESYGPSDQSLARVEDINIDSDDTNNIINNNDIYDGSLSLLFVVDCGTNDLGNDLNAKSVLTDYVINKNKDVILVVIDHHQLNNPKPLLNNPRVFIANPNLWGGSAGHCCAAALCWMFCLNLFRTFQFTKDQSSKIRARITVLGAIATLADMVPLTGINRYLVKFGLRPNHFRHAPVGLIYLKNKLCFSYNKYGKYNNKFNKLNPPTATDVSFYISPAMNAGSRMGESTLAVRCLTCSDDDLTKADDLSSRLVNCNIKRKEVSAAIAKSYSHLCFCLGPNTAEHDKFCFLLSENIQPSIAGITAGQLMHEYGLPSFVMGYDRKSNKVFGSARCPGNYGRYYNNEFVSLNSIITKAIELNILSSGGGHNKACGLALDYSNINTFYNYLIDEFKQIEHNIILQGRGRLGNLSKSLYALSPSPILVDTILSPTDIKSCVNLPLVQDRMSPFGVGLPDFNFMLPAMIIDDFNNNNPNPITAAGSIIGQNSNTWIANVRSYDIKSPNDQRYVSLPVLYFNLPRYRVPMIKSLINHNGDSLIFDLVGNFIQNNNTNQFPLKFKITSMRLSC